MKKYVVISIIFAVFAGLVYSHYWVYQQGRNSMAVELAAKYNNTIEKQQKAIDNANQKILDFQRVISYNHDECFNRVWPEEIIRATNPVLR